MKRSNDYKILESYIPIAEFIASVCGPRYEVVIHDLEDLEHSIMFIAHGEITGRKVNDGLMDFALETVVGGGDYREKDYGYFVRGKKPMSGRELRFATYYIKNPKGKLIGLLSVTEDITDMLALQRLVRTDLGLGEEYQQNPDVLLNDNTAISAKDMVDDAFDLAKEMIGCSDKKALNKDQRMKIVELLDNRNLFSMKGAISIVAKKMDISTPTIYRYLSTLKEETDIAEGSFI